MEFEDDAFVLSARAHGESGAIVELLTARHGKYAAHVAGGASRRMRPFLQAGARVIARFRARVPDQLGSAQLEPVGEGPAALFDDALALAGLSAAAAVAAGALPEREPHPGAFLAFEALCSALVLPEVWPAVFVRFEAGLLQDLGFGLDLSKCAATGTTDDLVWVSPRTGRAVSRAAGEPYKDRLLPLPGFLLSSQAPLEPGDVGRGLDITGHFLEAFIFNPMNRPLPPARLWLVDRLADAGRL
ncbi:MAG: DNA repair protein RecO [Phenylobacterium sp.]|jgi:DNA repair protein RecO (recombination protein O)|uniref:DNA repair protein RecO n=1 Tax=Phenylobacterium sp. TaxID=1871053 RepID=UPI002A29F9F5|nr:DNA repair protein RecO [Phenylobacterium sp.]MDD3838160.1 DNA repair protein RecO [Phenylobacterium sp.]MDX9998491.1 DNA repair protein RecO [Phenylobacterium sp.]